MSPVPDEDHDKHDGSGDDIENLGTQEIVIPVVIDGSDDDHPDDEDGNGYQLLPQGPDDLNGNHGINTDDSDSGMSDDDGDDPNVAMATGLVPSGLYPDFPEGNLPSYLQVPELARSDRKDILWNQPRMSAAENMDSGQIAKIKNAMNGFQLPPCNIPDWAKNVSEDKWKEQLLTRLGSPDSSDNMAACPPSLNDTSVESSVGDKERETG